MTKNNISGVFVFCFNKHIPFSSLVVYETWNADTGSAAGENIIEAWGSQMWIYLKSELIALTHQVKTRQ